ncbi:cytosolic phospholipase A2 gamma-like isoform X1 [Pygocentrus nattereri]|uniref:Phospholipase A2, group IVC (cytosolic, calcium-independent) n=1 Tax=Pygocentrus nattereri TaxID=42514 RepID=A0A3B4C1C2_PYGNA|nr:cytosolic phospholipase A2 gamma-like isoform X1 [Pygocentrus nattereri]XP_017575583.2 cytosolic phospholipase A2 gamma-like isoform X1 [Pygocentrus nattereri]
MDTSRTCESSEVRIDHSLSEVERQHLTRRTETVLDCLKQHGISCSEHDMPNIAVLGSGGGLRAMVGLLGSLSRLKKEGLLDCIMYLSGVSGSTWCMASLYNGPNWSTKLETVEDNIVQRLAEGRVSWSQMGQKLANYYANNENFSLTDVWAALIVSNMVNEIDEHKLTEQRANYTNDPYPIYTVIDKQCKYDTLNADVWFEITPDESGYSLSGAFVDSSCWGSQFKSGERIKDQPETDMLYLQGLCGSAIADMEENKKFLYEALKQLIEYIFGYTEERHTSQIPDVKKGQQALLALVELNLSVIRGKDPSIYLNIIEDLLKDKYDEIGRMTLRLKKMMTSEGKMTETELQNYNLRVCSFITDLFRGQGSWFDMWMAIVRSLILLVSWTWGTNYDFLYRMQVEVIDPSVLDSETRQYEDAGLLLNSPYFSVLRKERHIDLIISLDFSAGNPFETVVTTAKLCKHLQIPFPEVVVPAEDTEPQDFYVFRGYSKAPTVIHIPLFNAVNCKGEIKQWEKRYQTFQMSYTHEMITDLLEKAAENIKNNKEKLLKEIIKIIQEKKTYKHGKM